MFPSVSAELFSISSSVGIDEVVCGNFPIVLAPDRRRPRRAYRHYEKYANDNL